MAWGKGSRAVGQRLNWRPAVRNAVSERRRPQGTRRTGPISSTAIYLIVALMATALVVAAVVLLPAPPQGSPGIREGDLALDFTIDTVDGGSWTLSEQRGNVVVLGFTGARCSTCAYEARSSLVPTYGDFGPRGVRMISIDVNRATNPLGGATENEVRQFATENGVTWPIAWDTQGLATTYEATGSGVPLPTLLIINQEGVIVKRHTGILTATDLGNLLNSLL